MSERRLAGAAVTCAVLGAGLMVLVDSPWAIGAAVALIVAFIVLGAAAIATPGYLERDGEE